MVIFIDFSIAMFVYPRVFHDEFLKRSFLRDFGRDSIGMASNGFHIIEAIPMVEWLEHGLESLGMWLFKC